VFISGGDHGTWNSALADRRTNSRYHYYPSRLSSLTAKAPKGAFDDFTVEIMTASDSVRAPDLVTAEPTRIAPDINETGKNKIAGQMKKISDQRKLIADLEAQGKSARPERGLLRELLGGLEGILAGLRQNHGRPAEDASIGRESDSKSDSKPDRQAV
jgi:hypothetical protein